MNLKAQATKSKIDERNFFKLRKLLTARKTIGKMCCKNIARSDVW